jgi:hypothetical protein
MSDNPTDAGPLLGPSSTILGRQPDLEGYPKQECPYWAATACALYAARLYVAAAYDRYDWGQPIDLAESVRYYVLTARRLVPPLERALVLARGRGLLPGAPGFLGQAFTSACAGCLALGEYILGESCWAADLNWHQGNLGTADFLSDREDWDRAHPDPTDIDPVRLEWGWARDIVRDHLLGLWLPDPAGLMAQARVEALLLQGAGAPEPGGEPPPPPPVTCRLAVLDGGLFLDGEPVPVGGTTETRAALLAVIADLVAHPGVWRTSGEIANDAPQSVIVQAGRIWRYLQKLPKNVRALVESSTRLGYRLTSAARAK